MTNNKEPHNIHKPYCHHRNNELLECDIQALNGLFDQESGLSFAADTSDYRYFWIRDNCYVAMAYWYLGGEYRKRGGEMIRRLIRLCRRYDYKIDWVLNDECRSGAECGTGWKRLHPRYDTELREIPGGWGWVQNDSIGLLLWVVAWMASMDSASITLDSEDYHTIRKLTWYLNTIEYWSDPDNGTWEENAEVHASSVGCCFAGMIATKRVFGIGNNRIDCGYETLQRMLPNESETKQVDMAELALIWPLEIVGYEQANKILDNVCETLLRSDGVIRYIGDQYHNYGCESRWPMGIAWLGLCYDQIGNHDMSGAMLDMINEQYNQNGHITESNLTYGCCCEHTPLAWAHALALILRVKHGAH